MGRKKKESKSQKDIIAVGEICPDFTAIDQSGNQVSLKSFKGKTIVLYFYPKDNTPGCTKEACSIRDRYASFKKKNIIVLGVSKDTEASHQKFIDKYELPFTLLADTDKNLQMSFGVWQEKNMYGKKVMGTVRTTFIIGPSGKIEYVFHKNEIDCEKHAEDVLEKLEELKLI